MSTDIRFFTLGLEREKKRNSEVFAMRIGNRCRRQLFAGSARQIEYKIMSTIDTYLGFFIPDSLPTVNIVFQFLYFSQLHNLFFMTYDVLCRENRENPQAGSLRVSSILMPFSHLLHRGFARSSAANGSPPHRIPPVHRGLAVPAKSRDVPLSPY